MNGGEVDVEMAASSSSEMAVYMWGYLPGALPQRSPLLSPTIVQTPPGLSWSDVCGGGCGFAMAISDSGKLITWGSTDDLGQSYVTSGKHGETPEPFPLPPEISIIRAAAGWAHCVAVTGNVTEFEGIEESRSSEFIKRGQGVANNVENQYTREAPCTNGGEVYTWGWKECVPSGKVLGDPSSGASSDKEVFEKQTSFLSEQVSPRSQGSRSSGGTGSSNEVRASGEETSKRRRVSLAKQVVENSSSGNESLSSLPCLVTLNTGVRIATVAAGGRHTLALSDIGQVWGWGYGGEGQLGLGSRIRMVSSPHPVPCIDSSIYGKDRSSAMSRGSISDGSGYRVPGTYVKAIACGGRHSAVITDAGALLTFGWGLYGQCGQGCTDDELSPVCVSSLLGIRIEGVAAGLWHTVCISSDGDVYAFGGNQFGQLGTGADQAETLPRLLDSPSLENTNAKAVSCGARHSAVITEDGKVFCWGWNKYGQLGLGDAIDRNIPSEVAIEGCVPKRVACGWWHTLLLAESPT